MGQPEKEPKPVDSDFGQVEADDARPMTEEEFQTLQLNRMVQAQGRTIGAFQQRIHELEMRIIELMSDASPG